MPISLQLWRSKLQSLLKRKQPEKIAPEKLNLPSNPEEQDYAKSDINLLDPSKFVTADQKYIKTTLPYIFRACLFVNIFLTVSLVINGIFEFNIQKVKATMEDTSAYIATHSQLEEKIQTLSDKIALYKSLDINQKLGLRLEKFLSQVTPDIQIDSYIIDTTYINIKAHSETPLSFAVFISNLVNKKIVSLVQIKSALLNNTTKMFDVELEAM